jgi:phosphatidylinositol-3-phosphatase
MARRWTTPRRGRCADRSPADRRTLLTFAVNLPVALSFLPVPLGRTVVRHTWPGRSRQSGCADRPTLSAYAGRVTNRLPAVLPAVVAAVLATGGCTPTTAPRPTASGPTASGRTAAGPTVAGPTVAGPTGPGPTTAGYDKVLLVAEENHSYREIVGDARAPYLTELARTYGNASRLQAGYPPRCPSLAAYILLTSGTTAGICDDRGPGAHPLTGDSVFHQVAATGRGWRAYAESSPGTCALDNSADGRYLVRHVPSTYYVDDRADCARWTVPLGTPSAGALHDDVAAGRLPAFGFVTPDACHDMHGAPACPGAGVRAGDDWLRSWLGQVLAGPDYRSMRLVVIITWDEGSGADNHVPTLVISPTTHRVTAPGPYTHCSTLRSVAVILHVAPLGCAATAPSMVSAFHL